MRLPICLFIIYLLILKSILQPSHEKESLFPHFGKLLLCGLDFWVVQSIQKKDGRSNRQLQRKGEIQDSPSCPFFVVIPSSVSHFGISCPWQPPGQTHWTVPLLWALILLDAVSPWFLFLTGVSSSWVLAVLSLPQHVQIGGNSWLPAVVADLWVASSPCLAFQLFQNLTKYSPYVKFPPIRAGLHFPHWILVDAMSDNVSLDPG